MGTTSSSRILRRLPPERFTPNKNKKDTFPPPYKHKHASGPGVLGVQKRGMGRADGSAGELSLEEGGLDKNDDPDI
jgi:hypothetical protein